MLKIENITYGYKATHPVLENFSLQYDEPGVYGLLGKNGTGKSTLLYLIMGLLRPKSGCITLDGRTPQERTPEVLADMFLVPEEYNLPSITLPKYVKALRPFYPQFDCTLLARLLNLFDMQSLAPSIPLREEGALSIPNIDLGALSMGQKKKIYMCIALAARTKFLLMDEPTNGLDILSKSQFRKVLAQGMRDDQTVVISTHQVRDVETLLDHVTIVDNNRVLMNERMDQEAPVNLEELFIQVLTQAQIGG